MTPEEAKELVNSEFPKLVASGHSPTQAATILIQTLLMHYKFMVMCPVNNRPMLSINITHDGIVCYETM